MSIVVSINAKRNHPSESRSGTEQEREEPLSAPLLILIWASLTAFCLLFWGALSYFLLIGL